MSAHGHISINNHEGESSHLVLFDKDGGFTAATEVVDPVEDTGNRLQWQPEIIDQTANRLKLKLTCTTGKTSAKKKSHKVTADLDTGTLTITLTGGPPVTPVPVNYVNDDGT